MNKKVENAINVVNGLDTLTKGEHDAIIKALTENTPWYVKLLKVLKILGALAGYFLAGLGLSSCTHSFISPADNVSMDVEVVSYGLCPDGIDHVTYVVDGDTTTIFNEEANKYYNN